MITQLEELLLTGTAASRRLRARRELLETDEFSDSVIDVDDEVADLEIAKVREKRLCETAALLRRTTLFVKDVGLRIDLKARVRETEAS